jgi:tetratricopeptide (TPR) repeat protein
MKKRTILLVSSVAIVLGLSRPNTATAQWILLSDTAHAMVQEGLSEMYNLNYAKADKIFTGLTERMPENPAGYFLLALNDWWRIKPNIADDRAVARYSKSFYARIDKTIEKCDAILAENELDILGLFFKGAAYGYRARLKSSAPGSKSVTDWISVVKDANEGRKMLLECQRLAPSNSDVLLGSGLILYWSEALPEKVPALRALSLPPGDKEIGLQMLRIAGEKALYSSVEAKYALLEILTNNEKDFREALKIGRELYNKYPNNPDFHKYFARNLYYTGNFDEADTEFRKLLYRVKQRRNGYELSYVRQALYYLGDIQVRKHRPEEAVTILTEAVKVLHRLDEENSGYFTASLLKLGYAYDLLGQRDKAKDQYEKVLDQDDPGERYHPKARKYLQKPYAG